jgi:Protein of unknown function (DUF5672)
MLCSLPSCLHLLLLIDQRTLVVLALYGGHEWPSVTNIHLDKTTELQTNTIPASTKQSEALLETSAAPEFTEDPSHSIPEFDVEHLPTIPTASPTRGNLDNTNTSKSPESPKQTNSLHVTLDPTRVALIIETRRSLLLPALLTHFISVLPPAWTVQLVGLEESFSNVRESSALSRNIQSGKLVLRDLPDYYPVTSQELVSITLTNITFYEEFVRPAEWLLIFQTDSIICSASEQSIDDWVNRGYDWAGAPWTDEGKGGNGGLSLRHVPPIVKLLQNANNTRPPNVGEAFEDFWLSTRLPNVPPGRDLMSFSVESLYYERPLGYHLRGSGVLLDPLIWGNKTRKRQIFDYCPEIKIVLQGLS